MVSVSLEGILCEVGEIKSNRVGRSERLCFIYFWLVSGVAGLVERRKAAEGQEIRKSGEGWVEEGWGGGGRWGPADVKIKGWRKEAK